MGDGERAVGGLTVGLGGHFLVEREVVAIGERLGDQGGAGAGVDQALGDVVVDAGHDTEVLSDLVLADAEAVQDGGFLDGAREGGLDLVGDRALGFAEGGDTESVDGRDAVDVGEVVIAGQVTVLVLAVLVLEVVDGCEAGVVVVVGGSGDLLVLD